MAESGQGHGAEGSVTQSIWSTKHLGQSLAAREPNRAIQENSVSKGEWGVVQDHPACLLLEFMVSIPPVELVSSALNKVT